MEQNRLEEYINEHRNEFDSESPPPMIWMQLEKELDKQVSVSYHKEKKGKPLFPLMRMMQVAAMFVVVLGVGLLIGLQLNNGSFEGNNPKLKQLESVEQQYMTEVNNMWSIINNSGIEKDDNLQEDLNQLDEVYNELKKELLENPNVNSDRVIGAMLQNYKAKAKILEKVLDKYDTDSTENKAKLEDGKIEI